MNNRGNSVSGGDTSVYGNRVPVWLRNQEFREAWEARACTWTVMA